jgi:hypothetical protein
VRDARARVRQASHVRGRSLPIDLMSTTTDIIISINELTANCAGCEVCVRARSVRTGACLCARVRVRARTQNRAHRCARSILPRE